MAFPASALDAACEDWVSPAVEIVAHGLDNGKGRGLGLTRDVKCLETLVVARPFVVSSSKTIVAEVRQILKTALAERRAGKGTEFQRALQFAVLSDGHAKPPPVDISLFSSSRVSGEKLGTAGMDISALPVAKILETNAQGMDSFGEAGNLDILPASGAQPLQMREVEDLCGLWLLPSLLNHDCCPNVSWVHIGAGAIRIFATRDIAKGEELTDTYVNLFESRAERQDELLNQKGFACSCHRCFLESSWPQNEVDLIAARLADADKKLKEGRTNIADLEQSLAFADEERAVADKFLKDHASCDTDLCTTMFLKTDIALAQTLCSLSQHPMATAMGLYGRAARACRRVAKSIGRVAPFTIYHVYFLHLSLQMLLRIFGSDGGGGTGVVALVAAELASVWCARHGVALSWPKDLVAQGIAAFDKKQPGGPVVKALLPQMRALEANDSPPEGLALDVSQIWQIVASKIRTVDAPADLGQGDCGACVSEAPQMEDWKSENGEQGARLTWQLPAHLELLDVTVDISSHYVLLGGAVGPLQVLWPGAVEEASASARFSKKGQKLTVTAIYKEQVADVKQVLAQLAP
eukprot:TRINITY_DN45124_c0_g1_i2.p1 TRINITY_DN45124_c0_g1~~TRINITY_DN45124_c0_g1_i2.p1  ORF type:complete len:580 (-),score=79.40 TRINITY_DN45124_c0_g1_i2:392-2131(-)